MPGKGHMFAALPLALVILSAGTVALPVYAKLTPAQVRKIVEDAKILSPDYRMQASINGKEVVITTYLNPKATDNDCKIDAVLIAKKVMDADPAEVDLVKIIYYDSSNVKKYRQVTVRSGDVKAFGSGQISQDTLLADIELIRNMANPITRFAGQPYKSIAHSPEVLPGVYHGERVQLLGQIQSLQERGVGVAQFMAKFFEIEDKVRQGDEGGVIQGLRYLTEKVNEQTDQYNRIQEQRRAQQARAPFAGGPFPGGPPGPRGPGPAGGGQPFSQAEKARMELGDLAPADGPKWHRRYRVARRIADLRDSGQNVEAYLRLRREIEDLAATHNLSALKAKLRWAEHMLGLPSLDHQDD